MKETLTKWLNLIGAGESDYIYLLAVIGVIIVASLLIHLILHGFVVRLISHGQRSVDKKWQGAIFGHKLFRNLALTVQGVVVYAMATVFFDSSSIILAFIETLTHLWIIFFALLSLFSLFDILERIGQTAGPAIKLPLRGIFQGLKLVGTMIALIFAIAFLIGKSPLILFSGLGAMTAVVLLIFKDPLLGLVAGIQLSANNMLSVGDWLEMPKYGADGDVIDISLTTVKVRNWDKTITSIPSYALISDSFKNWRNIEIAGGRRIKRSINIDVTSICFLSEEDLTRLSQANLLTEYLDTKLAELRHENKSRGVNPNSSINARRLTNIGTFRAYLTAYLKANNKINHNLTCMVRQLEPGPQGIPLEIYGFTKQTSWIPYEDAQSDIFDHIYAVIAEFGLKIYQAPSGYDLTHLSASLATCHKD